MIQISEIELLRGGKALLKNASATLFPEHKVGLVGANGCGKSTLFSLLKSELSLDGGNCSIPKDWSLASVKQETPALEISAIDYVLQGHPEYYALRIALREAEQTNDGDTQAKVHIQLENIKGYSIEAKAGELLHGLGFANNQIENPVSAFSGGWRMRLNLAQALIRDADLLLLDEPTNHLDVYMVEFLEEILIKDKFTILLISHDRHFINSIVTRIIEIENMNIVSYDGGYDQFLIKKEQRLKSMKREYENLLRFLKKEEEWLSRGVKARLTRNQGRKKRILELRDRAKKDPTLIRKMVIELEREKKSFNSQGSISKKKMLFDIENLSYSIAGKNLIDSLTTRILQRDKIAVVGDNGSGKSTLLKILLGRIKAERGTIKRGDITIGYFDQHREMLDDNKSIIETFLPKGGDRVDVYGKSIHIYAYLKSFLFPEEYLQKKIGFLSGGEKNRIALALLFTKKVDCLILDEPTNDLDIQTINILEEKLINFQGALIFVSHDRYFIDKIASKLLIFKGNGVVEESFQNYSEYLSIEKNINELYSIEKEIKVKKDIEPKVIRVKKQTKLSYKEQRDLEILPDVIENLEEQIEELNNCLCNPSCYEEIGLAVVADRLKKLEQEYEKVTNRYLEVLQLQEELQL